MRKWSYLVLALGWTVSMIYEALFRPERLSLYLTMGILLDGVLVGLFFWVRRRERRQGTAEPFTKGVYFAAAVLLCVLLAFAVRQTLENGTRHVALLPLYLIGIAGALFAGLFLWRQERKEKERKMPQKNQNLPKGGA